MLVLSSCIATRYYNCCADGSTSPGNLSNATSQEVVGVIPDEITDFLQFMTLPLTEMGTRNLSAG
jgi:hypothetical protein